MKIRWNLRRIAQSQDMTGRELGERLGISEHSAYLLLRRDDMPRINGERLAQICAALNCEIGEIIEKIE